MSDLTTIYMSEWTTLKPVYIRREYNIDKLNSIDLDLINRLENQGRIKIRQYSDGIEITSNSYVGIIKLSDFQIVINPKIPSIHLARMISNAYGIDNIDYLDSETNISERTGSISEILALLYIKEAEKVIKKGLSQRYREKDEELNSCRGKIDFSRLAKNSSLGLTLPCRYQELTMDIPENRLLLATLSELLNWVNTPFLLEKINILFEELSMQVKYEPLSRNLLKETKQALNRMTKHYSLLIELSELIIINSDFSMNSGSTKFTSFLLDMNLLFERFLYNYFMKTTGPEIRIEYQRSLSNRYISEDRDTHRLIPDYMFYKGNNLVAIADAKL